MIPKDPMILLSFINTKLRDFYGNLEELCAAEDLSAAELLETLATVGYHYDSDRNQFVR